MGLRGEFSFCFKISIGIVHKLSFRNFDFENLSKLSLQAELSSGFSNLFRYLRTNPFHFGLDYEIVSLFGNFLLFAIESGNGFR